MTKDKIIEYLENKIQGCDELGGMEKEKWAFQQCLKETTRLMELQVEEARKLLINFQKWEHRMPGDHCPEHILEKVADKFLKSKTD